MVNYQDGKIYKIVDNTNGNVYIGSTCKKYLSSRLACHVLDYKKSLVSKYYMTSFDIIKNGNYDIVLIEKYPCEDKEDLHKRERFYIESINCVNKNIPTRIPKEYRNDNKEKIKLQKAKYRKDNREIINIKQNQICLCDVCNCNYTLHHKSRHERTQKHIDNLNKE